MCVFSDTSSQASDRPVSRTPVRFTHLSQSASALRWSCDQRTPTHTHTRRWASSLFLSSHSVSIFSAVMMFLIVLSLLAVCVTAEDQGKLPEDFKRH